jgi:hypothetical protein
MGMPGDGIEIKIGWSVYTSIKEPPKPNTEKGIE